MMVRDGADEVDLWAMAAELERQFAGYKQQRRLAGRRSGGGCDVDVPDVVAVDDDARGGGGGGRSNGRGEEAEEEGDGGGSGDVRGRMYEAYTRRRDERLRSGWRARMERKEADVMALWAQLDRGGRIAGQRPPGDSTADVNGAAGGELQEVEDDGERRRSSDVAAPGSRIRISGKKHARTRSFSSSNLKSSHSVNAGRRRALWQEPPPASAEPPARVGKDSHRARPTGVGTGAAPKRKALSGSKGGSAKEHGSVKPGPKPPRSLPRRYSSAGGLEGLGEAAAPRPNAFVAAPAQMSCSSEQASSPRSFAGSDNGAPTGTGTGTGTENARAASPDSDRGDVVDGAAANGGEAEAKCIEDVERRDAEEEIAASPETTKLDNGEITSDSETEPSYVYVKKKDVVEEDAMRLTEALAGDLEHKNGVDGADEATTAPTADVAAESATIDAEESPARESSDESPFSGRPGRGSVPNTPPSCSAGAHRSIERLLEAHGTLLRKQRDESAGEKSAPVSTPGSARSRVSGGTPRSSSPRETPRGFKKRFLSFGKKNKGREVTVIDCTSPSAPSPSPVDGGGSASGRWQAAESIKPRMGSSSDAASDDMDHGYAASPQACSLQSLVGASPARSELSEMVPQEKSPQAHRSFFSLRSFNCSRS